MQANSLNWWLRYLWWNCPLGLALLTLSWDKNWDSHSLVNGYPRFYPRIALVAPSPGHCPSHQQYFNIGSANGLMPSDNKALPEPILTQILWCHRGSLGHNELTTLPEVVRKKACCQRHIVTADIIIIWLCIIICSIIITYIMSYV